jgi:short-subunit dehydrogenase
VEAAIEVLLESLPKNLKPKSQVYVAPVAPHPTKSGWASQQTRKTSRICHILTRSADALFQ